MLGDQRRRGSGCFFIPGEGSCPVSMMGKREETVSVSGLRERLRGW